MIYLYLQCQRKRLINWIASWVETSLWEILEHRIFLRNWGNLESRPGVSRQRWLLHTLLEEKMTEEPERSTTSTNANPEPAKLDEHISYGKGATSGRSITWSLFYIMINTRPDLCGAASLLRAHVERPCQVHWGLQEAHCGTWKNTQIGR